MFAYDKISGAVTNITKGINSTTRLCTATAVIAMGSKLYFLLVTLGDNIWKEIYIILGKPFLHNNKCFQKVGIHQWKGDHSTAESVIVQVWQLLDSLSVPQQVGVINIYNDESWHPKGTLLHVITLMVERASPLWTAAHNFIAQAAYSVNDNW